jgi:hypothetical protein
MTIDLSQYVGKTIVVELRDQSVLAGPLEKDNFPYIVYPYKISGSLFTESGVGKSKPRIIKILTPSEGNGIAQKAPNINLDDFVGQKVYVKLARGSEHITNVTSTYNLSQVGQYVKNGTSASSNEHWAIVEIYGEGAYEINTKSTFDDPNDYKIEQAKQLLSQMSEEQVAKLLKSLK